MHTGNTLLFKYGSFTNGQGDKSPVPEVDVVLTACLVNLGDHIFRYRQQKSGYRGGISDLAITY